jgi:transcription termination factor Rho
MADHLKVRGHPHRRNMQGQEATDIHQRAEPPLSLLPLATVCSELPSRDAETRLRSEGVLEMLPDGYEFLRSATWQSLASPDDISSL